ncbi:MAG: transcriptional regulator [Nanoarchaeota archaeon]
MVNPISPKLVHPQEIEVWYILPAIRRELALCMKNLGLEQKDIAKRLSVTEAAVSYYINSKRAAKINFDKRTKLKIENAAKNLSKNKIGLFKEMNDLLNHIWNKKMVCKIHKQYSLVPKNCDVCLK